jgi:DNA-binding HxlR family transcriptional regulator
MGVAMGVLGGKWKLAIVWRLFEGKLRFSGFKVMINFHFDRVSGLRSTARPARGEHY